MARRAAFLFETRKQPEHRLVVGGGNYFAHGDLEQKLLGITVLQALQRMDYDALALGNEDFSYGSDVLLAALHGIPVVSTNMKWASGEKLGVPMIVKEYEGLPMQGRAHDKIKVAVLAFMDEHMQGPIDMLLLQDPRKVKISPMVESAKEWVPKAHQAAELVVALVQCNSIDAVPFIQQVPGIDVLVACRTLEEVTTEPRHEDATVIVANGDRGRYIAELRFDFASLATPEGRSVLLDQRIPEDPAMKIFIHNSEDNIDAQFADTLQDSGQAPVAPREKARKPAASGHPISPAPPEPAQTAPGAAPVPSKPTVPGAP